ncbi:MAG: MarR family winged helix-turn-helix transcriptional regulator [Bacteroidota bacterium]
MRYKFLQHLLQVFDQYQDQDLPLETQDFGMWLVAQEERNPDETLEQEVASHISTYLGKMGKFFSFYHKKVLKQTDLTSLDELIFLVTLYPSRILSKTDLIDENILEKTTGVEIIKRLKNRGYLEESADLEDKRKKNVQLSDKGKSLVELLDEDLQQVAVVMGATLTSKEQVQLFYLLKKLDTAHRKVYMDFRDASLADNLKMFQREEETS